MNVAGIICEYNPFHTGHAYMIGELRRRGADAVVCAMSGHFVQRGEAAVAGKAARAEMALRCGADLVFEIPTPWAASSAETFARGGVAILRAAGVVTELAFGSESGDLAALEAVARALDSEAYRRALSRQGEELPFAMRRQAAIGALLGERYGALLEQPNDILAVEYLRALSGSAIRPVAIRRRGAAHDGALCDGVPSGALLRQLLYRGETEQALGLLPSEAAEVLRREIDAGRAPARMAYGERAILDRLRRMDEEAFAPFDSGGEGLYHRVYRAVRQSGSIEELLAQAATKRYPTARLRRMMLHAWLDLPPAGERVPYLRLLAVSATGREVLRRMGNAPVLTKAADVDKLGAEAAALFTKEARWSDLYALTCPVPPPCGEDWRITPVVRED